MDISFLNTPPISNENKVSESSVFSKNILNIDVLKDYLPHFKQDKVEIDEYGNHRFQSLSNIIYSSYEDYEKMSWINDTQSVSLNGTENLNKNMSFEDYVAFRQEKGMGSDVNWNFVEATFGSTCDDISAMYVSVYNRISDMYTGDELEENLARLDKIVQDKITAQSEQEAKNAIDILEKNDISVDKEKIYNGILHDTTLRYEAEINKYFDFIGDGYDITALKDTKNEWLLEFDRGAALAMQEAYKAINATKSSVDISEQQSNGFNTSSLLSSVNKDNSYNINEINAIVELAKTYQMATRNQFGYMSEQEIGFKAAHLNIMFYDVIKNDEVSEDVKNIAKELSERTLNEMINTANDHVERQRLSKKEANSSIDPQKIPYINEHDVYEVYNAMISAYDEGKGKEDIWSIGYNVAYVSYTNSQQSPEMEHSCRHSQDENAKGRFFDTFHKPGNSLLDKEHGRTTISKLSNQYNGFMETIINGLKNNPDRMFKPYLA